MGEKRQRRERMVPNARMQPARLFRVWAHPDSHAIVEVHISRTRHHMRETTSRFGNRQPREVMGCVLWRHCGKERHGRMLLSNGRIVARMFLNAADLRAQPAEIIAHESGHAALAWGRWWKSNLMTRQGEEDVCMAIGYLTEQISAVARAHGVWR